jgi:hypothetical protein
LVHPVGSSLLASMLKSAFTLREFFNVVVLGVVVIEPTRSNRELPAL